MAANSTSHTALGGVRYAASSLVSFMLTFPSASFAAEEQVSQSLAALAIASPATAPMALRFSCVSVAMSWCSGSVRNLIARPRERAAAAANASA